MTASYITGCHLRLRLESENPFRVQSEQAAECKTAAMAIVNSHTAAITTCSNCAYRTGPAYIEPGVPWLYEAETPSELATEISEGAGNDVSKWSDLENYDPHKWASPGTTQPENISPKQTSSRPAPTVPEGMSPDPEDVVVTLQQAKIEEVRSKEPLVTTPTTMIADAPAQTPAATPPPYQTFAQKPPPEISIGTNELTPTPNQLLQQVIGDRAGGPSVHGWSRISNGLHCLRYYFYDFVAKMRKKRHPERDIVLPGESAAHAEQALRSGKKRLNPLWLGSLMHDVRAIHLLTGGMHTWEPLYAVRGIHPEYALETYRLMKHYLTSWGPSDNANWDVRGVEVESRYYYKARRVGGKARRLCVSSRHDGLIHPLQPRTPRFPVGQRASRIDINEFKSTRVIASTTVEGYRVDGQALLHCGTYKHGYGITHDGLVLERSNEEIYGPLNSLVMDWVVKVVNFEPSKHLIRQQYILHPNQIKHFLDKIGDFLYEEIGKRLWHKDWENPDTWPQRWLCRGIFYPSWICPFAPICENVIRNTKTIEAQYDIGEPLDRSLLELPKKRKRQSKKRTRAAAEVEAK